MRQTDLGSISASRTAVHATDDEIGAAELYHHETVLRTSLAGEGAPPWLQDVINTLQENTNTLQENTNTLRLTVLTVERIEQVVQRTSAVVQNMKIAKSNALLAKTKGPGDTSHRAKQKEVHRPATLVVCYTNDCFTF